MNTTDSPLGPQVWFFHPDMDRQEAQARLDQLHAEQAGAEFSEARYALVFEPGDYELDITVDYYVQVLGLGRVPGDVRIRGTVQSIDHTVDKRVTLMFWRAAENLEVVCDPGDGPVLWAVSQAAPFRRMHIRGDCRFDLGGWASGGLLANSIVEGEAGLRTGQQWFTRHCDLGSWRGGNWNQTFLATRGAPDAAWPQSPVTCVDEAPLFREKPFLCRDEAGVLGVFRPGLRLGGAGPSWSPGPEAGKHVPLADFHIALPERDGYRELNAALEAGKHLLLSPGIYELEAPIRVLRPGTIVMGLGFATLVPRTGAAAIEVADLDGVVLAGLLIDAGPRTSETLVRIGEAGCTARHGADPTSLHDVFCRVGGGRPGSTRCCLILHSSDVLVDHLWLWRADHGAGVGWDDNRCEHGLIVEGDHVAIYGLFNEHAQAEQTLWTGEAGRLVFYQSEMPYDPPSMDRWTASASYVVADPVQAHEAYGLGIYSFFGVHSGVDRDIRAPSAVRAPEHDGIRIEHITTFAGSFGGIAHPLNARGPSTEAEALRFFDGWRPR